MLEPLLKYEQARARMRVAYRRHLRKRGLPDDAIRRLRSLAELRAVAFALR